MFKRMAIALLIWAGIALVLIALFNLFNAPRARPAEIPYSVLLAEVEAKGVQSVIFEGNVIHVQYTDGRRFTSYLPPAGQQVERMLANGVIVGARAADEVPALGVIVAWMPFFVYIGAMWLFMARPLWQIGRRLQAMETALAKLPGAAQPPEH